MLISRNCPTCGQPPSSNSRRVTPKTDPTLMSQAVATKYWRGYQRQDVFFAYTECRKCDTQYCEQYFSEPTINDLYSSMEDNVAGESLRAAELTQIGYLDEIRKFTKLRGIWAEIGADIGLLSGLLATEPTITHLMAVERNTAVHKALQDRIGDNGSVHLTFDAKTNSELGGVVAIHVLDHLISPRTFLEDVNQALEPGGTIALVTHSHSSLLNRVQRKKWAPYCMQHPQLFSPKSIKEILRICGFEDIKIVRTYNHISLWRLVQVLSQSVGVSPRMLDRVPKWIIRLPLGNIMTLARKRDEHD